MKEYGGYIELDMYSGEEVYPDALALNSGRAALRFLIRLYGIRKIYLPAFCCSTVWEACEAEKISWEFYSVDKNLRPIFRQTLSADEWFYLVNFYGVLNDEDIREYGKQYPQLILDYTHAFFQRPLEGMNVLYSCRKFFGVPDGAYLYLGEKKNGYGDKAKEMYDQLPQDYSYERMHFLLGRFEAGASPFYAEYAHNNERFSAEPIKKMSALTHNLLRAIDYSKACRRRTENYIYLHRQLKGINELNLPESISGAYAYPFLYSLPDKVRCGSSAGEISGGPESLCPIRDRQKEISGKELRRKLIQQHIYVPTLWPEVGELEVASEEERRLAENILPLPADQRYTKTEMQEIEEILLGLIR